MAASGSGTTIVTVFDLTVRFLEGTGGDKGRSRFPEGMTERKARATAKATATATANTGVLRCARDDGKEQVTARNKALQVSPRRITKTGA